MAANPTGPVAREYRPYKTDLGSFQNLPKKLDMKYTDVIGRIYPLAAKLNSLTQFCDNYLNRIPETAKSVVPIRFKPAAPFVLMEVVNYGKMTVESQNLGWFSQHELAFGIPLEQYEYKEKKWSFVKWVLCYPFIYVDSPLSMAGGRQVYGWTKELFRVDAEPPIFDPTGVRLQLQASITLPSRTNDDIDDVRTFLTVSQEQISYSAKTIVPDLLTAIPKAIASSIEIAYGLLGASNMAQVPFQRGTSDSFLQMIRRFYGDAYSFLGMGGRRDDSGAAVDPSKTPPVSLITLKQFRDAIDPKQACLQAIVESEMSVDRITDARLMSDLSSPDSSAGITIMLLDCDAQPLVKMLGLQGEMNGASDAHGLARIKPFMPFWVQMDVSYGSASKQVWRTPMTDWTQDHDDPTNLNPWVPIPYIELGSGADDELSAPFDIPDPMLKMRFLPLKADWDALNSLIASYLNAPNSNYEVAPFDKVDGDGIACVILGNFAGLTAKHPESVSYSDSELTFAIPVKWRAAGTEAAPYTYGLFPAYTFVGKGWNAATNFEVYGRLSAEALFSSPSFSWEDTLPAPTKLPSFELHVTTQLLDLKAAAPVQDVEIVEIFETNLNPEPLPALPPASSDLEASGLLQTSAGIQLSSVALKQVRDAMDPTLVDFQSIVQIDHIYSASSIGWLPQLTVKVREYESVPIMTKLGLTKYAQATPEIGYISYVIDSIKPWYFIGSMGMSPNATTQWAWRTPLSTSPTKMFPPSGSSSGSGGSKA